MSDAKEPVRARDTLRELRSRLRPKLSLEKMADAIGWGKSSYQYYEDKFKEPELPAELRRLVGDVLFQKGVPLKEIRRLGAYDPPEEEPVEANPTLLSELREMRRLLQILVDRSDGEEASTRARRPKKPAA